ncbi:MAG: 50S ribosomal protein L15 [Planctomycetes bacterium]|nr:50S ribosomal protein L15 [Planctomycetota bacterium]MBI3846653.1 50S ribosomal protein L15 [Planctomycetota bacterium]
MILSDIRRRGVTPRKHRKRIGCGIGSGHGKTSTRGHKGQKARSGGGIPAVSEGGQMPLIRRLPKRGFHNIFREEFTVLNVSDLNGLSDGDAIDPGKASELGLVRRNTKRLKILGGGELQRRLVISAHKFSASAKAKIEKAGGEAKELPC